MELFKKREELEFPFLKKRIVPPLMPLSAEPKYSEEPLPPLPPEEEFSMPSEELPSLEPLPTTPSLPAELEQELAPPARVTPLFVRIDKYREILRTIKETQDKLENLRKTLDKIRDINTREAEIISGWTALMSDTKSKIDEISSGLFEPAE